MDVSQHMPVALFGAIIRTNAEIALHHHHHHHQT